MKAYEITAKLVVSQYGKPVFSKGVVLAYDQGKAESRLVELLTSEYINDYPNINVSINKVTKLGNDFIVNALL